MARSPTDPRSTLLFWGTPLHPALFSRHHFQTRTRMPHSKTLPVRLATAVLLISVAGCGSDLVLPDAPGSGEIVPRLMMLNGDPQSGPVGEMLSQPLKVKVLDQSEAPVEGVKVIFEVTDAAGGSLSPTEATTSPEGEAVSSWTLGTVPGSYVTLARVATPEPSEPIEFHATAVAGAPDTLSALSSLDRPGNRNQPVQDPPRVRVVDRFGNPVPGIPVVWQVIAGRGQVSGAITTSDAEGVATVGWTLGDGIGFHKLTATVEQSSTGSPVVFLARVYL